MSIYTEMSPFVFATIVGRKSVPFFSVSAIQPTTLLRPQQYLRTLNYLLSEKCLQWGKKSVN